MSDRASWPAVSVAEADRLLTAEGSPFETVRAQIRGQWFNVWKHAPPSTREVLAHARSFGSATFLIFEDERTTFDAFCNAVAALAANLSESGLRPGDRVAIAMRNLPEWPVAFFAASACGAILVPLNAWWTGPELAFALQDSGAAMLFADAERFDRLRPIRADLCALQRVYIARCAEDDGNGVRDAIPVESVIGSPRDWCQIAPRALPDVTIAPDDDATIFYTSGTTGRPKGAVATHRSILSNLIGAPCIAARSVLRRGDALPQVDPEEAQGGALLAVPLFHVTGCLAVMIPALYSGSKLALMRRWDARLALELIERERLTRLTSVAAISWQLVNHPEAAQRDLSSLQIIGNGGGPVPPELARALSGAIPAVTLGAGWGMTETSALATTILAEDYMYRPSSCGAPVPGCEAKIMDDSGKHELPRNSVGELWFRGQQVARCYWNHPQASAETFHDGWVRTGDLARIDEDGFIFIVDRLKDIVIRGGENIYCIEIEDLLHEHPAVAEVALVGRPHAVLGEEPVAIVVPRPGAPHDSQALRDFVAARLAAFTVPADIIWREKPLPRNPNGKVLKGELRRQMLD